ncbi:MAG: hypothetical protein NZ551_07865 [Microscillaceae bacterium]|nr:hypothetical protein [Microscillaceae bacterium]MDW8461112.1 hypothetical protein [Cytophagales bacterium]
MKVAKKIFTWLIGWLGGIFFCVSMTGTFAQVKQDTIWLKKGMILIYRKKEFQISKDTFWILQDKHLLRIKTHKSFWQRKWVKKALDLVYMPRRDTMVIPLVKSENPFLRYEGKRITRIDFKRLKPFATSVLDTTPRAANLSSRLANALHMNTRVSILKKNLLVKQGDTLNAFILADNERILRSLPFLRDVRIVPIVSQIDTNQVHLLIITQDNWSISSDGSPNGIVGGNIRVFENNLLGLGHRFEHNFILNLDNNQIFGYEMGYLIKNLGNRFAELQIRYANVNDRNSYGVFLQRRFVSPIIRYAGGLQLQRTWEVRPLFSPDSLRFVRMPVQFRWADAWLARAFSLSKKNFTAEQQRTRLIISARYQYLTFLERPRIRKDSLQLFHHQQNALMSIALNQRNYYKANLIYAFGKTEDVPYGFATELTFGKSFGEFFTRPYIAWQGAWANFVQPLGYLYLSAEASTFGNTTFANYEQGLLRLQMRYFTYLYKWANTSWRHFLHLTYTHGYRRFAQEVLDLNNERGIRGYGNNRVFGTNRLAINFETIAFLPVMVHGFRIAVFAFADVGVLSQPPVSTLPPRQVLSGFGLGVRLRNDNLSFNALQFRLAYYPTVPAGAQRFILDGSDIFSYQFLNFETQNAKISVFR